VRADDEAAIREAFDAFSRGDVDAFLKDAAPDVEYRPVLTKIEGDLYRGHEGVRLWLAALDELFADMSSRLDELHFVDEGHSLAAGHFSGRGRKSGAEFDLPLTWIYTVRDGELLKLEAYTDRDEALRAEDE